MEKKDDWTDTLYRREKADEDAILPIRIES